MDSFTATVVSPGEPFNPQPQAPKKSFRLLFLFLLLATLASASATAFILITGKTPQVTVNPTPPPTAEDNPFLVANENTNPFAETAETSTTTNPFNDDETANPFDLFDANEATGSTQQYQNPF